MAKDREEVDILLRRTGSDFRLLHIQRENKVEERSASLENDEHWKVQ